MMKQSPEHKVAFSARMIVPEHFGWLKLYSMTQFLRGILHDNRFTFIEKKRS